MRMNRSTPERLQADWVRGQCSLRLSAQDLADIRLIQDRPENLSGADKSWMYRADEEALRYLAAVRRA
jgi:hypothetical protein